ncbi:hypothetical protein MKX96_15600 [Psychrobacillus sp. FSL W7-1493]|uniref:hypothetical protein n=1 Tax=Psychrobacillus sp. FSL W7-1493 TaxID=2921552 RepID=UPI0030F6A900
MDVTNVYVDFKIAVEEGTSFFRVLAQCFIYKDSHDDPIQIGEASLHLFNPVKNSYLDLCGEADCLSDRLSYSLITLEKFCEIDKINSIVAVFHTLNLKEPWDERELSIAIYKKLEEQLSLLNVELIVISNSRHQVKNNITGLSLYFNELGFTSFQKEKEPIIMYKKISNTYAEIK